MKPKLLIIIPVYNEEAAIGNLLDEMHARNIQELGDILVINDGSTDRTQAVVEERQVNIINKPFNLGYGSTLQLGYKYATSNDYEYIIQLDGDGQHDLSNISVVYEALIESAEQPDIVIGSRFLSPDNKMDMTLLKKIAIGFFRKVIKIFTKQEITDPTSGLQGLNRSAFSFYAEYGNFDYQYPDINMIIQMLLMGYKIQEVPAQMHNRTTGKSMHSGVVKPVLYMLLMSLSTLNILIRQRENYYQLREKEDAYKVPEDPDEKQLSNRRYITLTTIIALLLVMIFFVMDLDAFVREKEIAFDQTESAIFSEGSLADFANQQRLTDEVVLIEGEELKSAAAINELEALLAAEKKLIFLSLPTPEIIEAHNLQEMLGIRKISGQTKQKKLNLVTGFMLGGLHQLEKIDYHMLDVELSFTTKVYGYGEKTADKDYPVIWRNTYDNTEVYVVNGPFMQTGAFYGMLAALMAEIEEDYIYPVLNSRVMVYESFPYISEINKEWLEEKYNRDAMKVQNDILLPNILSINKLRGFTPNGFFRLGFDEPLRNEVSSYEQRQLTTYKELFFKDRGEIGLRYTGDIQQDQQDYQQVFGEEPITSVMVQAETTDAEIAEILDTIGSVQAIVGPYRSEQNYQYLNNQAVYLPLTGEGFVQNGQDELEVLSLVTAFGAMMHSVDLEEIIDAADEQEKWTGAQTAYARFLDDYREPFIYLDNQNITEMADVVKTLLAHIPTINKSSEQIELRFQEEHEEIHYILRTTKKVKSVTNGRFKKIEEDAYLIKAIGQQVQVQFE